MPVGLQWLMLPFLVSTLFHEGVKASGDICPFRPLHGPRWWPNWVLGSQAGVGNFLWKCFSCWEARGTRLNYQWGCKSVLCVLKPTTKPFWAPRASPPGFFIRRKMETVCFENHETLLQGFGPLHFFLTIWETVFLLAVGVQKGHVMGVIPPYPLQPTPSLLKHVWEKSVLIWILRIKTASKQNQEPGGPLSENSTPASNLGDTSF